MANRINLLDHFLSLFNTVAHPIAVTKATGEIIFINSEFEDLTTLSLEILRGVCIDNLFPPEQKKKVAASLTIASQQNQNFVMREHHITIRRKSRRQVPVDLHMSKVQIDNHNLLIFSFSDLTAIKTIQKENEKNLNEIMHLSRLADIGRLSAGIAHELNNPLQVIMGLAENLKFIIEDEELKREELQKQLDPLLLATSKMATVIYNMMKMVRQEPVEMKHCKVSDFVDAALTMVKGTIDSKKIVVKKNVDPNCEIYGNSNQLEQVLLNLLANAFDSMEDIDKEKTISIDLVQEAEETILRVSDNGQMIPEHIQKDIMSPFFTTKASDKGMGLGLFVSFGIVKAHSGSLKLEQSTEEETTFSLSLPALEALVTDGDSSAA